jgi:hypothetical protein
MSDDLLARIQQLQFSDKAAAEVLLKGFIHETFPQLDVRQVELRPLAVSLNSFNGYLTVANGEKLFFKTHIETDGVVGEYYRAEQLAEVGYPILRPLLQSNSAGKQLLIYPYIDAPSVFDVAWRIEQGDISQIESLTAAQYALDDQLFRLYESTLRWQSADEAARAPIHQLFYHRLTGGRLQRFYESGQSVVEVGSQIQEFRIVTNKKWYINSQHYTKTLKNIINISMSILHPLQVGAAVVGHGDAHNGNVFFHKRDGKTAELSYFDPAFGGIHHPLLDLTKPLFHNVFAVWMYYPQEKAAVTDLEVAVNDEYVHINHNYVLHPIREMFLRSKIERVLVPTLRMLKERGWLHEKWRSYLKAALFCCPFLTKNLIDAQIFPPKIAWLGLAYAVEMGAESEGKRSLIDTVLNDVEARL